ncbi:DUF4198 domain-containing protein [Stenotrophomonas sp. VV52]|uniref:DUF4198 domain-containing protein n=1 Tax=Stenotrophomonas sp. VV52 TaxID=2066958 RepID=UPI000C9E057B|nr:DUF4198 domain-containing protein [Stenotrophomonas sp. VV52]
MSFRPVVAFLLAALALPAAAHTPYLAPASFEVRPDSVVTLDASFAEAFFVPEVVFDNSEFVVTLPDGTTRAPDTVQRLKTRAVIETTLPGQTGTYRFSTGNRLGAVFRTWDLNGKPGSSRDPAVPLPAGAKLTSHYQSLSRSEVYLTAGGPTTAALKPYGTGLELVPVTHPSDLYRGEHFDFIVQYDGKPLPNQKVEIHRALGDGARQPAPETLTTDAQGKARFALAQAGSYLALIRYRGPAPAGAAAPMYGNNYTLSFRVLQP